MWFFCREINFETTARGKKTSKKRCWFLQKIIIEADFGNDLKIINVGTDLANISVQIKSLTIYQLCRRVSGDGCLSNIFEPQTLIKTQSSCRTKIKKAVPRGWYK